MPKLTFYQVKRARERERERETDGERQRERESARKRERERERERARKAGKGPALVIYAKVNGGEGDIAQITRLHTLVQSTDPNLRRTVSIQHSGGRV